MTSAVHLPALVEGEVRHERFSPVRHAFRHRAHQWLLDVDEPEIAPRWLRSLASVQSRDHLGSPEQSLGHNVRAFLRAQGVTWSATRIVMLANARTLGYVFDPLSVYWCYAADGSLEGVLAEVHNTYGERHGYVVQLDDDNAAEVGKDFYVSPFLGVFGDYRLKFTQSPERVGAFVTLKQDGKVVFTGSFTGRPVPATSRRLIAVALRRPFMPQRVAALIRLHGVLLWLRRLPVVRRRQHLEQEGSR